MHDIPELTRQYDAAKNRAIEANRAAEEARTRLNDALCNQKLEEFRAAGGVVGETRVRVPGRSEEYLVTGALVYFGKPRFEIAKVKKDGTPYANPVHEIYSPATVEIIR